MQLTVLLGRGTRRDDAQLPPAEIQSGTREHLAVSVDDHPLVEIRMEAADVPAETLIHLAVHDGARRFPLLPPIFSGGCIGTDGRLHLPPTPLAHRVERPRKSGEEVTLQYQFFDPCRRNVA